MSVLGVWTKTVVELWAAMSLVVGGATIGISLTTLVGGLFAIPSVASALSKTTRGCSAGSCLDSTGFWRWSHTIKGDSRVDVGGVGKGLGSLVFSTGGGLEVGNLGRDCC